MGALKIGVNPGATSPNFFTDNGGPGSCASDGDIDFTAGGNSNNPEGAGEAPQDIVFTLDSGYTFATANAFTVDLVDQNGNKSSVNWSWSLNGPPEKPNDPPANTVLTVTDPDTGGNQYEYTLTGSSWNIDPKILNHR